MPMIWSSRAAFETTSIRYSLDCFTYIGQQRRRKSNWLCSHTTDFFDGLVPYFSTVRCNMNQLNFILHYRNGLIIRNNFAEDRFCPNIIQMYVRFLNHCALRQRHYYPRELRSIWVVSKGNKIHHTGWRKQESTTAAEYWVEWVNEPHSLSV